MRVKIVGKESPPCTQPVPDSAESDSCHAIDVQSLVIDSRGGVVQPLLETLGFEKWILRKQGGMVRGKLQGTPARGGR
jgi:hypothetical protein